MAPARDHTTERRQYLADLLDEEDRGDGESLSDAFRRTLPSGGVRRAWDALRGPDDELLAFVARVLATRLYAMAAEEKRRIAAHDRAMRALEAAGRSGDAGQIAQAAAGAEAATEGLKTAMRELRRTAQTQKSLCDGITRAAAVSLRLAIEQAPEMIRLQMASAARERVTGGGPVEDATAAVE